MAPIILATVERSSMRLTIREYLRQNTRKALQKRREEIKAGNVSGLGILYRNRTKKEMKKAKYIKNCKNIPYCKNMLHMLQFYYIDLTRK